MMMMESAPPRPTSLPSPSRTPVLSPQPPVHSGHPLPPPPPHSLVSMSSAICTTTSSILPLKMEKPIYSSPPPAASNPENNTCKMIDYRGAKIAAFRVDGRELVCLPQAFELFLKHLVGGLHTVYTKLKRLDITPIVCNVEQVRILRGLGAIQPGVNRCKLISPGEFDVLYDDCTNSSARPGRPPKRSPIAANPETIEKLKKQRMEGEYPYSPNRLLGQFMFSDPKKSPLFGNGYHYPPHLASMNVPFMPLGHPMMTMAMANHIGMRADGSIIRERHAPEDLASPRPKDDGRYDENSLEHNNNKPLDKPLNLQMDRTRERRSSLTDKDSGMSTPSDVMTNGQLDLSMKHSAPSINEDLDDDSEDDKEDDDDMDDSDAPPSMANSDQADKMAASLPYQASQMLNSENTGISSVETLLMNIQGLLKVASENARHRERQMNYEKAELKMELIRERELRESLEKQMGEEQRTKINLLRRLKKEKKARRKLQDTLEMMGAKTHSMEDLPSPKPLSSESHRSLNDGMSSQDSERDRASCHSSPDRRLPGTASLYTYDAHSGLQNLMETFLGPQKSCNGSTNGYLHPPVIKATESV